MGIWNKIAARLPQGSLGRRSLVSGAWSLAELGIGNLLRLASNLILTRLLLPEAFGLMAMVTTVQIGIAMLSDLGIRQSVIRADSPEDPEFLRTAWTVQVLRGLVIAGLVVLAGLGLLVLGPKFAAPGTVYADPVLPWLVMVSALSVLMEALGSTNLFMANRRMELGRLTFVALSAQIAGIVLMVALALHWASVWALLIGGLAAAVLKTALGHLVFPGPAMRFAWNPEVRAKLWLFGRWIIGSSALSFVTQHADRLILGALMPTGTLGLYMIGLLWVQAYGFAVAKLANQVGLAALAEVRRERSSDLPRLLRKTLRAIDLFCLPGFAFFMFFGPEFITLLYSPDYEVAGQFIPLLSVLILVQRFALHSELLVAEGRSFSLMMSNAASAVAVCIAIPLGYALLGVTGAIAGSILAPLVGAGLRLQALAPLLGPSIRRDWAWLGGLAALTLVLTLTSEIPVASWRGGPPDSVPGAE